MARKVLYTAKQVVLFGDPILKACEESNGSEEGSLVRDRSSWGIVHGKIFDVIP